MTMHSFFTTRHNITLSLMLCGAFRNQWKLLEAFFNRHTFSSLLLLHIRIQHIDITNAFIKERSLHRIYIYILKQQNEFWRHAPRGRTQGNTHIDLFSDSLYAFSSLTRLLCVAAVRAAMRRNPIHLFFPAFAGESTGGVDLFFLKDDPSLCVCCGVFEGEIGFSKTRS